MGKKFPNWQSLVEGGGQNKNSGMIKNHNRYELANNTSKFDNKILFLSSMTSLSTSNHIWFLDCKCKNHMKNDRKMFPSIKTSNKT